MGVDFDFTTAIELSTFGRLIYSSHWWTNSQKETNQKKPKKALKKDSVFNSKKQTQKKAQKRLCSVCSISIENKRKNTKYCSKKCNNTLNGKKRTSKRKQNRKLEIEHLQKLIPKIYLNRFDLLITYKSENIFYSVQLHQLEIFTTSKKIRQIKKTVITEHRKNAKPIILTTLRAKQLIRIINNHNIKHSNNGTNRKK